MLRKGHSVLPGFGLTLGYSTLYLSLIVLLPLAALAASVSHMTWEQFWSAVADERAIASYRLTVFTAAAAAATNAVFGFTVAWCLARYRFPGRRWMDAVIDLPFALPTAVSGIVLTAVYSPGGWLGAWAAKAGLKIAYTPAGIVLAMVFIGLPFVVRMVAPAIEDLDPEIEEAAASLGAGRLRTFTHVLLPALVPSLTTGFALAFARGLGEYGSVIFIAGNMPMHTEITSLLIVTKLDQYDYAAATSIALVMLAASFLLLLSINLLQSRYSRRYGGSW